MAEARKLQKVQLNDEKAARTLGQGHYHTSFIEQVHLACNLSFNMGLVQIYVML